MKWKTINRIVAGGVFLYALILYFLTMAPTVSFWDPGERIAVSYGLEIPHPPGAPFYMLLGRFFSMFVPADLVAPAVNMISVLASAGTVLLAYLIIVRLIRRFQGYAGEHATVNRIVALASGVIGAVTFSATDSFWFNAGIAETYALSLFLTALAVWLALKWSGEARERAEGQSPDQLLGLQSNRYLVLIAYLFGLTIGVHLLGLLALFFVALIVFFTVFDAPDWSTVDRWKGIAATGAISSAIFLLIYPGIIILLPSVIGGSGAPVLLLLGLIGLLAFAIYYTHTRRMQAVNLAVVCATMILIGYSSYALIPIRSAADPGIDQNNPETTEAFVSYLEREQYGESPLFRGPSFDDAIGQVNREEETLFPRRHSPQPQHWDVYNQYNSDLDFFVRYQVGHMYVRYFLWNFAGRASDVQDAPAITGIPLLDPDSQVTETELRQTPSQEKSKNVYFALPLLLGLFGAFFHFSRDWRRAFSLLTFFLVSGIGIIIYLNQTPMQPRERDYSYVASFFAFSLWIGIGASGLLQLAYESLRDRLGAVGQQTVIVGIAALTFLAVPLWMLIQNYDVRDRSDLYVARDYAENMLTGVEENGIIFTNGDNDTFPLWYLQEVEGIRPDVRVVNLSLLNTSWYARQLRDRRVHESEPLPISLSDEAIDDLRPMRWEPQSVELPVDEERVRSFSEVDDQHEIESPMSWTLEGQPMQDGAMLRGADQVVYDILRTNAENGWERPIYFAITVAPNSQLDLRNYFQLEGKAFRVVPISHNEQMGRVVSGISDEVLERFQFETNLDDPGVYLNENKRRMLDAYRNVFSHTGEQLALQGHPDEGRAIVNRLMSEMPFETVAGDMRSHLLVASAYEALGDQDQSADLLRRAEPLVFFDLERAQSERSFSQALQFAGLIRQTYQEIGDEERLDTFDDEVDRLLAQAPFQVPAQLRAAYGLRTEEDVEPDMPMEMMPEETPAPQEPPQQEPPQ